jgi:DNA-binding IclR family transcriptional regulator
MAYVPSRVIALLKLFSAERPNWTAEEMAQAIGVSTSTAYRYITELAGEGFLDAGGRGGYALGPAFIQYDAIMRRSDQLIAVATPLMQEIIAQIDPRIDVVLSRLFKNGVLCIHQENGSGPHPPTTYARGAEMPIFRGATSKVILANLSDRALKRLYLENEREIHAASPDMDWKAFRSALKRIRKDGYCITLSEVASGRIGIAAPIFRGDEVIASMSVVLEQDVYETIKDRMDLPHAVVSCASAICHGLTNQMPQAWSGDSLPVTAGG